MGGAGTAPTQDQPDGSSKKLKNPDATAQTAAAMPLACCALFNPFMMFSPTNGPVDPSGATPSMPGIRGMLAGLTNVLMGVSGDMAYTRSALDGGRAEMDPVAVANLGRRSDPMVAAVPVPRGPGGSASG